MDAIKKKMQSLKTETETSLSRAEQLDAEAIEANRRAEKTEEHVSGKNNKKMYGKILKLKLIFCSGSRSPEKDAARRKRSRRHH
jgi:hypothetical protein